MCAIIDEGSEDIEAGGDEVARDAVLSGGSAKGPQMRSAISREINRSIFQFDFRSLVGAAREIRTPDPIITNLTVLDFSGFPAHSHRHD
jgi:hypothetical protein